MKIFLGPAGVPICSKDRSTIAGIRKVKELGLNAMEIEFVRQVYMSNKMAKEAGREAKKLGIKLSVHAPYFINLASEEKEKIEASKKRILDSCERAHYMGADPVVFHPAYFGKRSREECFGMVKKAVKDIQETIKRNRWKVRLAPETTGKHSALGSLKETIQLAKETKCFLCIDPAHLFARKYGKIDFAEVFDAVKPLKFKHLHFHFSGIEYTAKGEKNHVPINHNPDFRSFAKELVKRKQNCTIISESPVLEKDALKMKKVFESLRHKF